MPYGITQCYLPPGRGDIPALTPAEAGTRLSDPGGMQGSVDLQTNKAYLTDMTAVANISQSLALPTRWRRKPAGADMEVNYVIITHAKFTLLLLEANFINM